jgi:hypothetical protein
MQVGKLTPAASWWGTRAIISFAGVSQLAGGSSASGATIASLQMTQANGALVSPRTEPKQSWKESVVLGQFLLLIAGTEGALVTRNSSLILSSQSCLIARQDSCLQHLSRD